MKISHFLSRTGGCALSKALIWRSQVLLRCLSLATNYFFRKYICCVFARKLISLVKFVSIEVHQNTKVQAITSVIDHFITKFFKLVHSYELAIRSYIVKSLLCR